MNTKLLKLFSFNYCGGAVLFASGISKYNFWLSLAGFLWWVTGFLLLYSTTRLEFLLEESKEGKK